MSGLRVVAIFAEGPITDDWKNLSVTTSRFLLKPDWKFPLGTDYNEMRELLEYPGTKTEITALDNRLPMRLKYTFTNVSKADEHTITDFYIRHRGKLTRFWVPVWKNQFRLYRNIVAFDSSIAVYNTGLSRIDHGYEMLFIEFKNGAHLSRRIDAVVDMGGYEEMFLAAPISNNIQQDDIAYFSRLILARFDNDELEFTFYSNAASKCVLTFRELQHEYEES